MVAPCKKAILKARRSLPVEISSRNLGNIEIECGHWAAMQSALVISEEEAS
jgi:hypothetical protein